MLGEHPYTVLVQLRRLHPWNISPKEAMAVQARLAAKVVAAGEPADAHLVAGADIALAGDHGRGAVVLLSYPDMRLVETVAVEAPITFPYIPGLLAFREVPVLAQAFERLQRTPDLLIVDGHGHSHMRRFGIACHLGLLLDIPTIGCAKSRLVGRHADPLAEIGGRAELRDGPDLIGLVLRTRQGVSPVYVSVGHRIGLSQAADWLLRLCRGYRLPEPSRLADQLSKGRALHPSTRPAGEQAGLL